MKVNASQRSIGRHPTTAIEAAPTQPPVAHRFAFFEQPLAAWTREYRDVLIAFISSRLLIVMLMGFSTMIVAPGENGPRRGFAGILTQGDGARYVEIASAGYGTGEEARAKAGLFPLYPSLVATVSIVVRDATISAILVSNLALLGAGMLLKELLERHYASRSVSRAGLTFLMFGPVSFFFSGAYPEATLLMFTIAALLAADMQRWKIAAAAGACASATSAVGVIVLLPLAWEYIVARRERRAPGATIADGLLLVIVPLGCAAVLAVSWFRTGDALAPLSATDVFRGGLV
ncbi:MAG TPA: hypothetical protein VK993_14305, partial [Chthoniobacterales bacterium]|nr:hypothetical protein [Chthoniobacterales bacterium]